ncbi:WbqC family protein [Halarcobacter sp.]|uniref:WbqC family protein n=1 Tax=Halarcobacter sp. TaxID=2321133 RepID=UPI003A8EC772
MQNKICAIHQPNFFPWLGYFDKIKRCDKFVVLDNVQYQKKGGTWSNRVAVNIQGESKWLTAPINRPSGLWDINETSFQSNNWRDKIIKTLQANYSKAPFFKENRDFIFELINFKENNLSKYNLNAIVEICRYLNIEIVDKLVLSSDYNFSSSSNELLIDLTRITGCNAYMAGGGASDYQNINLFEKEGIDFIYQSFEHPLYKQYNTKEFIKGLSIIDYIFNCGNKI